MAKINLKDFYPFYEQDCYIEVSNEVAETLAGFERSEQSYKRKLRRHKAYYSLDREDGIELDSIITPVTPEEAYDQNTTRQNLYSAISSLPAKQAKRIYSHYLLGMSRAEIAKAEGVCWSSVDRGIHLALVQVKEFLKTIGH